MISKSLINSVPETVQISSISILDSDKELVSCNVCYGALAASRLVTDEATFDLLDIIEFRLVKPHSDTFPAL